MTIGEILWMVIEATLYAIIHLLWGIVYATVFLAWYYGGYLLVIAIAGYLLWHMARSVKITRRDPK